jgi:hypothetical protein
MKRNEAFPSKYLTKEDVTHPKVFTIAAVVKEEFEGEEGKREKPIVYFSDDESKPMVLNSGNWLTIEELYGEDSDDWCGKRVELYNDPNVMFGKKRVGGIRVRAPQNGHAETQPAIFATPDAALQYANSNGFAITKTELIEALKATGATGWNPKRDSAWLLNEYLPKLIMADIPF